MSRYLEDAARVLKAAETYAQQNLFHTDRHEALEGIASGYATLAAIDKGLLPAEITQDVIETLLRSRPTTA
ncbi:hypothetical protein B0E38_02632 [Streptomyces sp. 111WW2]|uniref:hypothetical protein n=1 Tax=Streptomyces sp. 111WW2 TaxID=1945515 RepID=UPI000D0C7723|nr:hypothetical protein [Streptomyces sp. 111WW2]PSK57101.1 hypothetical protein B0E38_02632 [Streptomyces sp. 111WW2]